MERYEPLKKELVEITGEVEGLIDTAAGLPGIAFKSADKWKTACAAARSQLSEDRIRVAVVGPIKSGKSTFANALLKGDYLKRGAGVVTSIVTRIVQGESLSAELHFKSWNEINDDIEHALVLFPSRDWLPDGRSFDLRRETDRQGLGEAMRSLSPEQLITNDARNANSVLLWSYLGGFDQVAEYVGSETSVVRFDERRFPEHRRFVGDDVLAVYLKDIRLTVPVDDLLENIELADCQGSDSPNPLHLAMIQDYLLMTHLIIYVISSRTGLRRADLDFISIIRKMGISDHLLFVLNVDFSEHETGEDLEALFEKVREELAMLVPSPRVFPISALFRLFKVQKESLPEKDRLRLEQWESAADLLEVSEAGECRFLEAFRSKLFNDACGLLFSNPTERLYRIASGIGQLTAVNHKMLTSDATNTLRILERVRQHLDQMGKVRDIIRSTLDGGQQQIQRELRSETDRFFDEHSGETTAALMSFIRNYAIVSASDYEQVLQTDGFHSALYRIFQEFRQALETYMAENTHPDLVRFVRKQESRITERLYALVSPYQSLVRDAVTGVNRTITDIGVDAKLSEDVLFDANLDMERVRRESGLTVPPVQAVMRFSAKVKTEAVLRLGAYRFLRGFRKLLRKPLAGRRSEEVQALEAGVKRMKQETENALKFQLKDYRENLKFRYLFLLLSKASDRLAEILLDRIETYASDLGQMVEGVDGDKSGVAERADRLIEISSRAEKIVEKLKDLRKRICPVELPPSPTSAITES
ncbi:MAG: dynamin family protein [Desulfobacterales bacterium]